MRTVISGNGETGIRVHGSLVGRVDLVSNNGFSTFVLREPNEIHGISVFGDVSLSGTFEGNKGAGIKATGDGTLTKVFSNRNGTGIDIGGDVELEVGQFNENVIGMEVGSVHVLSTDHFVAKDEIGDSVPATLQVEENFEDGIRSRGDVSIQFKDGRLFVPPLSDPRGVFIRNNGGHGITAEGQVTIGRLVARGNGGDAVRTTDLFGGEVILDVPDIRNNQGHGGQR